MALGKRWWCRPTEAAGGAEERKWKWASALRSGSGRRSSSSVNFSSSGAAADAAAAVKRKRRDKKRIGPAQGRIHQYGEVPAGENPLSLMAGCPLLCAAMDGGRRRRAMGDTRERNC